GVSGNGQSELLEILSGIRPPSSGTLSINGHEIGADNPAGPSEIKALGVAHVPEDRHAMGLVLPFSAAESAVLGYEDDARLGSAAYFAPEALHSHCAQLMAEFDVRPASPELKSNLFSGGNQQKLVLAREISSAPKILLVGQPTRGVDIGAIEFIHKQLLSLRDKGCAIILVSVELDEILSLSDRVMVMNAGQNMGIIDRADATIQTVGLMMAGVVDSDVEARR
ncbi:MAG: ATP-binding cassette domain-containing protein, partial [Candidatus Puniceispirillaceae bacterium]